MKALIFQICFQTKIKSDCNFDSQFNLAN